MSIAPEQMFRNQPELYSAFDEEGIPTVDAEGRPVLLLNHTDEVHDTVALDPDGLTREFWASARSSF